jgi:hypothetical protein
LYTLPIGLKLIKYPDSGVAQIRDTSFSRQPSGQWFTPAGGCVSPPLWPFEAGCIFYRDFSSETSHFVPKEGSRAEAGEEDCVPPTAALGLVTLPAATAANLTRGDNFSCTVYMERYPLVLAHSDGWSGGRIMPIDTRNVTEEGVCKAMCAKNTECAGLTYVNRTLDGGEGVGGGDHDSMPRGFYDQRYGAYGACVLYSEIDRQSFARLPGCHNWVKEPKCPLGGGGSGCLFFVSGSTRHPLNCTGANETYADGICPKPVPCVGTQASCAVLDPCMAAAAAPAFDLTDFAEGAEFNCSMLAHAKYAPRYALLYGPLLLAATGPA